MKKIIYSVSALLALAGCKESIEYADVVFFSGTESSPVTTMYIDGPASKGLTVTSSAKLSEDMTVSFEIDEAALEYYNASNGTSYKMLPEGSFEFSSDRFKIEAGKNVSLPVNFTITSMDDFDEGILYCVPVTITGTSNGMDVLEPSRTTFLVVKQIITTRGVNLKKSNYVSFPTTINNAMYHNLSACTLEIRVLMNSYQNYSPFISSVIGVEENFLVRFGDVSCDKDQLQYSGRGASLTSKNHFGIGKWYHIACVDDGSKITLYVDGEVEGEADSSGKKAIDLAWDYCGGFHIGYSCDANRKMDGYVSEARVWNRALNIVELENNQCYVDPSSEGLLGYWRLNETDDNGKFEDLTGNGNHGTPQTAPIWVENIKCPIVD